MPEKASIQLTEDSLSSRAALKAFAFIEFLSVKPFAQQAV